MEADINSGNNATIAISGGTFNLNNSSLISGKQTITVSDGEFEMQGGSFVRQTGEGSIIFSMPGESASTSGIIFKAANGGIEHTGSTGSITIQSFMDCTIAASRGLGKTIVPTVIVIMGSCVFRVIWVYSIFAHFHTIPSLYLLYPCSWALTAIAEIIYFVHCYRDSMKLFHEPVTVQA